MINKNEVQHISELARINLSDGEIEIFRSDLNKVLGYIEVLKSVDTEGVEPLAQVTGLKNVFRDDRAASSDLTEAIIKNAPDQRGRFIRVKGVFE